jgi:hypothetical protein
MLEIIKNGSTSKVKEVKALDGIIKAIFEHEISRTTSQVEYAGPMLTVKEWQPMLSFFRWTYSQFKSESQVRLFIDPEDKKWIVWAFPQESGTGMTAREIDCKEAKEQRAALPHADKLILFGTVHHHCSGGAFQSGPDANNEQSQDGLHITVGKIDQKTHDLDCRLYVSGMKFTPNMSVFWDVGEQVCNLIPEKLHNDVAIFQMCQGSDVEFPKQWSENLIEIKRGPVSIPAGGIPHYGHMTDNRSWFETRQEKVVETAWECINDELGGMYGQYVPMPPEDLEEIIHLLHESDFVQNLIRTCRIRNVDMDDVTRYLNENSDMILEEYNGCLDDKTSIAKPKSKAGKKEKKKVKEELAKAESIAEFPSGGPYTVLRDGLGSAKEYRVMDANGKTSRTVFNDITNAIGMAEALNDRHGHKVNWYVSNRMESGRQIYCIRSRDQRPDDVQTFTDWECAKLRAEDLNREDIARSRARTEPDEKGGGKFNPELNCWAYDY